METVIQLWEEKNGKLALKPMSSQDYASIEHGRIAGNDLDMIRTLFMMPKILGYIFLRQISFSIVCVSPTLNTFSLTIEILPQKYFFTIK